MIEIKADESLLIDVNEVKKILHIGNNKVYDIIKNEKIPHINYGKKIMVLRKGLYEWIEKKAYNL